MLMMLIKPANSHINGFNAKCISSPLVSIVTLSGVEGKIEKRLILNKSYL